MEYSASLVGRYNARPTQRGDRALKDALLDGKVGRLAAVQCLDP